MAYVVEGGGKDNAGAGIDHLRKFQSVQFGHLDVEEKQVDVLLGQLLDGLYGTGVFTDQLQKRGLVDVAFQQPQGEGLVVYNGALQIHIFIIKIDYTLLCPHSLLLPVVTVGIGQFQTLAHLFQADAASAFICHAFGMIAVGYFAMYLSGAFTEVDTDKAGLGGGDAMLEGILYERDEYHRGDLRWSVGANVENVFQQSHWTRVVCASVQCSFG